MEKQMPRTSSKTNRSKPKQDEGGGSTRTRPESQSQSEPNQAGDSATSESGSAKTRKKGNEKYKMALRDGIPPLIKCSRLEDAMKAYIQAANTAFGPTRSVDWSSAMKNYGMTNKRLAQEFKKQEEMNLDSSFIRSLSAFKESLKSMSEAFLEGLSCQPLSWRLKIQEEIEDTYLEILEVANLLELKQKFIELYRVVNLLPPGATQAMAKFHIGDAHFKASVRLMESGEYKKCLDHLHNIHQLVEEALSVLAKLAKANTGLTLEYEDLDHDLQTLKQDTLYHLSTAESLQARKCGEKMLAEMLENHEHLNMDVVWDIVDWFKQAYLKAAELDLEQEAAALSFLGLVNEKILFSTVKTKSYYKRCMELVDAAQPKTFLTETWYQQCVTGYRKIQDAERRRDEAAQSRERQEVLENLTAEISALNKANTSAGELLAHIYTHHAPTKGRKLTDEHLKEFWENEEQPVCSLEKKKARKKILLKAFADFHPDKFSATTVEDETEEDQKERKVLSEEIMKMLTRHHELLKMD
ncbi:uncharacterized protein [Asterias amurensis]|uniref:uncharacterized protein n=1 Tax=Asterias amurensis TaxID=7602 RepID=UPI003AB50F7E